MRPIWNLKMCPDGKLNLQPFGEWNNALTIEQLARALLAFDYSILAC